MFEVKESLIYIVGAVKFENDYKPVSTILLFEPQIIGYNYCFLCTCICIFCVAVSIHIRFYTRAKTMVRFRDKMIQDYSLFF